MDRVMLTAFVDELEKISSNLAITPLTSNRALSSASMVAKPAVIPAGNKPQTAIKALNPKASYSTVNSETPTAASSAMSGATSAPPPPVRT